MASEAFQLDVMELLQKHYPRSTKGSIEDNAGAASDLAVVLGAMLAFSFRLNGEVVSRTVLEAVIKGILENAAGIDASCETFLRQEFSRLAATSH